MLPTYFYLGILYTFQHICNSYSQHHPCSQNVHRTRDIISPPHHCAFRSTTLSYIRLVQISCIPRPSRYTAQDCYVGTLCGPCTILVNPFQHLMGEGPIMLVCLHALTDHLSYSYGSNSVQLLPLPKPYNKRYSDAAIPRFVLMDSWSYDLKIVPDDGPAMFGLIRLPSCLSQKVAVILFIAW